MILITGVAGFAGTHLARLCAQRGIEVAGLGRHPRVDLPGVSVYEQVDLHDGRAVRDVVSRLKPKQVVHLAAQASVARSWETPGEVISSNVTTSLNLLEAVRLEAPDTLVLVACSGEEYGRPQSLPVDESHPLSPRNPYATSKAMVDVLAGSYVEMHGMRVLRARAFNHAGPGQSDTYVVARFARQVAEAEAARPADGRAVIVTGNVDVRRDFCDVRDVVRAYLVALEQAEAGVFNVCSGRATRVSDILSGLAAHSPLELECRVDPSLLRENEVMEIRGSHERLTEVTGWRPEIDLSDTLRDTLDWWRERVAAEVAR
ncbi:MAG TPA: GDP-mannose 4,6-dehydratase [Thermoleophilaceae bacterium]